MDANSPGSIAQGNGATITYAQNALAIGTGAKINGTSANNGTNAIAIGNGATVSAGATNAIAQGTSAGAGSASAVAIGNGATVDANSAAASAIGNGSGVTYAQNALALDGAKVNGTSAKVSDGAIAVGNGAAVAAGAKNAVAIGTGANTTAASDVALGNGAKAVGTATGSAVSIGAGNTAKGAGAIAMGDPSVANGQGAIAQGYYSNATADGTASGGPANGAVALGNQDAAGGQGAVAIGNNNSAIGQGSVALGNSSQAQNAGAVALGDTANAVASNGLALGSNAVANNQNDVALGAGSVTSTANPTSGTTIAGTFYNFKGTSPASVVSVGSSGNERQITNVAAGQVNANSTDAINGSQLYAADQAITTTNNHVNQLGANAASALGGGSTYSSTTGTLTAPSYALTEGTYGDVAHALTAIDGTANKGWNLQANGDTATQVKPGDTVQLNNGQNIAITRSGENVTIATANDLTVNSATAGNTVLNNSGVTVSNGPNGAVSLGNTGLNNGGNKIVDVAAGDISSAASTDAVNGGQLYATNQNVTNLSNSVNNGTAGVVQRTSSTDVATLVASGGTASNPGNAQKLTNLAAGTVSSSSTEAINGSQLYGTANSIASVLGGGSTVNPDGTVQGPSNIGGTGKSTINDAIASVNTTAGKGWNITAQGANGTNIAPGGSVDLKNADGNIVVSKGTTSNDVTFDLAQNLAVTSVTTGNSTLDTNGLKVADGTNSTTYGANGLSIAGGPSVTASGINAGSQKITNVAPGTLSSSSTDAINGGQLFTTNQNLSTVATNTSSYLGGSANVATGTAPSYTVQANTYHDVGSAIGAVDSSLTTLSNSVNNGTTGVVQRTSTTDVATLVASGGTASNPGNAQKLTNLAAGAISSSSTDAVNGSQLYGVSNSVANTLGGGSTVNPDGTVQGPSNIGGTGKSTINDAIASVATTAGKGWNITAQGTNGTNVVPGGSVDLKNADGNIVVSKTTSNNDVTFDLAQNLAVTSVTTGNSTLDTNGLKVADGTNSTTYGANGFSIAGGPSVTASGINAGSQKITNVAAGDISSASSTDAVNGGQLYATNQNVSNLSNSVNNGTAGVVQRTSTADVATLVAAGGTASNLGNAQTLTNLAAGAIGSSSTDAINGSQLYALGNSAASVLGGNATYNTATGQLSTSNVGGTGANTIDGAIASVATTAGKGWNITAQGANGTNVAPGASVDLKNADGNIVVSKGTTSNDVTFDLAQNLAVTSVTTGNSTLDTNGLKVADGTNSTIYGANGFSITGGPSVSASGIDAGGQKITNLASGTLSSSSTDAVNGSQLYTTNQNVATVASNTSTYLGGGANVATGTAPSYSVGGTSYNNIGDALTAINDGAAGVVQRTSTTDVATLVASGGTASNPGNAQKLTNLAAGTLSSSSTDAVNGSQLYAVGTSLTNLGNTTVAVLGGNAAYDPTTGQLTMSNVGGTGANTVDAAIASVNTAAANANKGWNYTAQGGGSTNVKPGDTVDYKNTDGNIVVSNTANGLSFDLAQNIAVTSVTTGNSTLDTNGLAVNNGINSSSYGANGVSITGGPSNTVSLTGSGLDNGGNKIVNVAAGTLSSSSTDAVNGAQLHALGQSTASVLGGNATYDTSTGQLSTSNVGGTGANTIDGAIASVNATATNANKGWNISTNGGTATNVAPGATVDISSAADGNVVVQNSGTNVTVGLAQNIAVTSVTTGNSTLDTNGLSVDDGSGNKTTVSTVGMSVTDGTNTTTYGANGVSIAGGPSLTASGIDAGSKTITNVAAGAVTSTSTDAVNGSQLYAVQQTANAGWNISTNGGTATNVAPGATVDISSAADHNVVVQNSGTNVIVGLAQNIAVTSVTTGNSTLNTNGLAVNDGSNSTTYGSTGMSIANGPSVTTTGIDAGGMKVASVAAGALSASSTDAVNGSQLYSTNQAVTQIQNTGVFYNTDTNGGKTNQITLQGGDPNAPVLISNVKAGTADTDAVNVQQLKSTAASTLTSANSYTDTRTLAAISTANSYTDTKSAQTLASANAYTDSKFGALNSEIGSVRNEARQAAAIGLAASSLRYDDRPGKISAAMGGGVWRGQGALAMGLGYTSEDQSMRANVSATTAGGQWGVGAGVSFTFN